MQILVNRTQKGSTATLGDLAIDGAFFCHTLEDAVREIPGESVESWKVAGKTAIPAGTYSVIIDFSNRFGRQMPHILNVPGFDGVRIHKGNTDKDTEGCILVGMIEHGADFISQSSIAFDAFFPKLQSAIDAGEDCSITIV
jgi:hypothetical protein